MSKTKFHNLDVLEHLDMRYEYMKQCFLKSGVCSRGIINTKLDTLWSKFHRYWYQMIDQKT